MENESDNLLALPFGPALRCKARSKRTGFQCLQPAVNGWRVCRMHGAGGGAPCGPRHGMYRHGRRTKEALALRKALAALTERARKAAKRI